jgi:hypothetical protein
MRARIGRWLLGLVAIIVFAGVMTLPQAAAADTHVAVTIGHTHRRHYRRHYVVYYRHGRAYRVYR